MKTLITIILTGVSILGMAYLLYQIVAFFQKEKKEEESLLETHAEGLKQIGSLLTMIIFTYFVGSVVSKYISRFFLGQVAEGYITSIYWVSFTGIFLISFTWMRKIKPFHKGVLLILGRPIYWGTLPSGFFWMLPEPLMSLIEVDIRQKDLDIKIKEALSKDNVKIDVDVLIKASVTNPYQWLKTEEPDKALKTLVQRNIRVFVNQIDSEKMPGQKIEFSDFLEKGNTFDEGKETELKVESVSDVASQWGYQEGIAKCIINDIRLPEDMVKANIAKKVEEAQVQTETTQQNLFLTLLGGGDLEKGRKAFLQMSPEERAKNIQAERGKRTVITADGNLPSIAKSLIAGAVISKGGD